MEVLDKNKSLRDHLVNIKNKEITIVSAFGSGTERVVAELVKNNKVEIIVGTINSFTSPDFISYCSKIAEKQLSFFVDFRYESSIHWKLYLVHPNQVIIGSANFTGVGLDLVRDTCVVFNSRKIYDYYLMEIQLWKKNGNLVSSIDKKFEPLFEKYKESHRQIQVGKTRTRSSKQCCEWLDDESNQMIPVFIWTSPHSAETKQEATEIIESFNQGQSDERERLALREFFTWNDEDGENLPYQEGDVVLCLSKTGSHASFYTFDKIQKNGHRYFIFCFKKDRYFRPFNLSISVRNNLKRLAKEWLDNEVTQLGRSELLKLT